MSIDFPIKLFPNVGNKGKSLGNMQASALTPMSMREPFSANIRAV
jgi:hypothetical protein